MKWIFGALLIIIHLSHAEMATCHILCKVHCNCNCTNQPQICKGNKFHTICKVNDSSNCNNLRSGQLLKVNISDHEITIYQDKNYTPINKFCFINDTNYYGGTKKELECEKPNNGNNGNNGCDNINNPSPFCDNQTVNLTCLNLRTDCTQAMDSSQPRADDLKYNITSLNGNPPVCYRCGDAHVKPNKTINSIPVALSSGVRSSLSHKDQMNNIHSQIDREMGKETLATISSNETDGIFLKPVQSASETADCESADFETEIFIYSGSTKYAISEDKTDFSNFSRIFLVPKEAFQKAYNLSNGTVSLALFRFPKFEQDEKNSTLWENEVFSIDFGVQITDLNNSVDLIFRNVDEITRTPTCHSWNGEGSKPNWTTEGCNTTVTNNTVTCSCNHLTFFAVLMSDPNQGISGSDLTILTYITSIGCGLSIFFLSVALFRHFLLRKARASHLVHILINLILAILLLNLTFVTNEYVANTGNAIGCKIMAGLMHYFMLSSFQWFCIKALHLCLQIITRTANIPHYLIKLQIAGWAPPVVVVACIFATGKYDILHIHTDTEKMVNMCWITDSNVHYIANIGYYAFVFLFTFLTFVLVLYWLFLLRTKRPNIEMYTDKTRPSDAMTIMGLFCMLGLGWGFAFFAYGPLRVPALYIFTSLNSFQGFFLFIYYHVTSKPIMETETETENVTVLENPYDNFKPQKIQREPVIG